MMENIKQLFYAREKGKYAHKDMPEVAAALAGLNTYLEKSTDPDTFRSAEEMTSGLYIKSEMQGFVYGFQYAMCIAAECFADGRKEGG